MKLRLMCLPEEAEDAVARLGKVFDLIEVSDHYPCRGTSRQVRIYIETRP